jgi:hypothetical protein
MKRPLAVAVCALLALPAAASAHPGVYTVSQQRAAQGCEYPTTACLTSAVQYAVANDGWAKSFTEDNGVGGVQGDGTAGMLNYKAMPSSWRGNMTAEEKRTFNGAQTDLQAHATCADSALLNTPGNVRAWQDSDDPFFNYIPWQKTSAGLGDEPSHWIGVVKAATGVDLATLNTEADFQAACEGAPVSGAYHKADTGASITSALETAVADPLKSQIASLQTQVGTLTAAKAAAEAAQAALVNRPLTLELAAKTFSTPVAMVTGAAGTKVTITIELTSTAAKRLKLSRTLKTKTVTLGAQGAALINAPLSRKAAKALKKHKKAVKVTVEAAGGGTSVSAPASVKS